MAGIHQYTSSQFIQSGSAAEFQTGVTASEITVEGTVFATEYKKLDGSSITGTGGIEFFAGSGSGISRSLAEGGPFSQDHFFTIEGSNKVSDDQGVDVLKEGLIKIETTGSATFNPNYFNFIKVGNDNEDLVTVQQGSEPSYTPESNLERRAGTHRYIIYAAQTGSSGETHQVFHTVTLDAFVNVAPVILPGNNTEFTIPIVHDSKTGSTIINSFGSSDANIEAGEEDFFTKYRVNLSALGGNPSPGLRYRYASYTLSPNHPLDTSAAANIVEILSSSPPGLPNSSLFATASLTSFNILYEGEYGGNSLGETFVNFDPEFIADSTFTILLEDNYPNDATTQGIATVDYKIKVTPPNKALIENSRVEFKSNGFLGESTSSLEQTLLYDLDHTLNSSSIKDLHPRYTSSLIRLRVLADITEPEDGLNPPFDHYTKFRIQTQSSEKSIFHSSDTLAHFRINGNEQTASAIDFSNINGSYLIPTESDGFTSFEFYPNYTNNTQSLVVGTHNFQKEFLNNTLNTQHGNNHHYEAFINNSPSTLVLKKPLDVIISDTVIEITTGSYNPQYPFSNELTSSLLYGFNTSLLSSQTQSQIIDIYDTNTSFRNVEQLNKYLSQSIVKVRLKATVTEPFGPTHNPITMGISPSSAELSDVNFTFSSESGFYTNSPTHENINGQELLVGRYTSSWEEFQVSAKNVNQTFSFIHDSTLGNVNVTNIDPQAQASITMSNAEPTIIENIVVEVESGSFLTGVGHPNLTSSLLYGLDTTISSSLTESFTNKIVGGAGHTNYKSYISQSIVRSRLKTKITEPFGPITSKISASIVTNVSATDTSTTVPLTLETGNGLHIPGSPPTLKTMSLDVASNSTNPDFITSLNSINLTNVRVKGDLQNNNVTRITVGDYLFPIASFSSLTYTLDGQDFTYGNNMGFKPFGQNVLPQEVAIVGGQIEIKLNAEELNELELELTFDEPILNTSGFSSSMFLLQPDQSDNYNAEPTYINNKLVTEYITPFTEIPSIPTGSFNFSHKFISASTVHTTSLNESNAKLAIVSMSGVEPTLFKDIRYEIETHGYSEEGTLTSVRTVLYGDQDTSNHTYATSESAIWNDDTLRATALASQSVSRFRILTTIEEPFGPGIAIPNFTLKLKSLTTADSTVDIGSNFNIEIHQNTSEVTTNKNFLSSSVSKYVYDINDSDEKFGKLTTSATSSWLGISINSPEITSNNDFENYKASSSLNYNFDANWVANDFQIVNDTNETTLNLFNVPKTEISFVKFRTETFGYSEIFSTSTTRSVLYGDPSVTNEGTGSGESGEHFSGHNNSIPYASHSVTRFNFEAIVDEPVGHLHSDITIVKQWTASSTHDNINSTLTINTSSNESINNGEYISNKLRNPINTGFIGQILSSSNQGGIAWTYTGSITHPNVRGTIINNIESSKIQIKDTPDVIVTRGIPLIETFGDSEIGVDNQNIANFANKNRTILTGETTTSPSSEGLLTETTASAVLRIQNQLKITEPLGYAHKNIESTTFVIQNTDGTSITPSSETVSNIFKYNTSSANVNEFGYNENFLLTSSYTSSFGSGGLSLPEGGYVYQHDLVSFNFETPNEESLTAPNTSKQLAFKVNAASAVQITNLFIEVENTSGSGVSDSGVNRSARSTQILYGKSETENNPITNNTYPNDSSKNQLVSARILFSCLDPVGVTHFTPTVAISGALDVVEITFSTASSTDYNADPNTTDNGLLTHYTSSFFPLRFTAGNNQTIIASASKVNDLGTSFTTSSNSNEININVASPDTTNIVVSATTLGSDINENKQFVFKPIHTDGNDGTITVAPVFNANQPTLRTMANVIFPTHLDKTFSVISNATDAFFTDTNPSSGVGMLRMDSSDIKSNTTPETTVVRSTVSTTPFPINLPADSDFDDETITIIPAQPRSMDGENFATETFAGHPTGMENTLYTGDLPLGLTYYKSGHNKTSTNAPTQVTNIYKTGLGEGANITLHTHTNGTADYTGNYTNNNRAYNFGDSGSLKLIISGTVAATYDLQGNFNPNNKTINQAPSAINFTGTFSGKGNLTINNIKPFNSVSDSVLDGSTLYPNGYQAWDATVNITSQLQSGYTTIQLVHEFDDSSLNQTINLVDWYYDDGTTNPSADSGFTLATSEISNPSSFYLSGVQFYIQNAILKTNLNNVADDIPHETISPDIIGRTTITNGFISSGSSDPSSGTQLTHRLSSVANKNGLIFNGKNMNVLTPTKTDDVASIQNIKIKSYAISENTSILGDTTPAINFQVKTRDNSTANSFNYQTAVTKKIGRFAALTSSNDTRLMEDFSSERYRWAHNADTNFWAGAGPWNGTSAPNYNPETNILGTNDLQQVLTEKLVYPIANFNEETSFPNSANYSGAQNGDRYYYRAFEFQSSDFGAGASLSNISFGFNLEITSTFTESELINVDGSIESKDIKIDVRIPNGGTEWGVVSSEIPKTGVIYNDVGSEGWLARNMGQDIIVNSNTIKIPITLHSVKLNKASGIILVRIRLKTSSTSKEISKVEFTV